MLREAGLNYSQKEQKMLDGFFSSFLIFEENDIEYYDMFQLLSIMFLLSKSSQEEKAKALFNLYDDNGVGKIDKLYFETAIYRLIDAIFFYSEKLLDIQDGLFQLHEKITNEKVREF